VNRKFGAIQLDEVIAHALRVVGAGVWKQQVQCDQFPTGTGWSAPTWT
jgi:hypothetical protein